METTSYDVAVVGGGIAGLAAAEIFARSGRSVVLLEREPVLCAEASSGHHGWFHFGSLYSIFPQNQFLRTMVGGIEDLRHYYGGFAGMNIATGANGRLSFPQSDGAWVLDQPIEYIVCSRNDPDFNLRAWDGTTDYAKKLFFLTTWEFAIKQFISRHQRFYKHDWAGDVAASHWIPRAGWADYSREVIQKPDHTDIDLDVDTHFRIVGYDRAMRAPTIVGDLVAALLGAGGDIRVNANVVKIEQSGRGRRLVLEDGRNVEAKTVILSAGKWMGQLLPRATDIKIVGSPLLVAYPAVTDRHFARMTPFVERSVNHLHHEIDGRRYSVIGGGYFADPSDPASVERARTKLRQMAEKVFPKLRHATVLESYLGYKTEIVAHAGERNYQYIMREVEESVHAVIPGKFSLGFSLAVNLFKNLTGTAPGQQVKLASREKTDALVGPMLHGAIVRRGLAQ